MALLGGAFLSSFDPLGSGLHAGLDHLAANFDAGLERLGGGAGGDLPEGFRHFSG